MGVDAFTDCCVPSHERDSWRHSEEWPNRHIVAGWTIGETTCPLSERTQAGKERDDALELKGYEGIRIRRDDGGYLQPVQGLIERFDLEMREAGDVP